MLAGNDFQGDWNQTSIGWPQFRRAGHNAELGTGICPCEDIGRAGVVSTVVALVTVYSGGTAVFIGSPDHHRVTRHRHRSAELVKCFSVGGLKVCLLTPGDPVSDKDIGGTGGAASFSNRADYDSIF